MQNLQTGSTGEYFTERRGIQISEDIDTYQVRLRRYLNQTQARKIGLRADEFRVHCNDGLVLQLVTKCVKLLLCVDEAGLLVICWHTYGSTGLFRESFVF